MHWYRAYNFICIPLLQLVDKNKRYILKGFFSVVLRNADDRTLELFEYGRYPIEFSEKSLLSSDQYVFYFMFLSRLRETLGLGYHGVRYRKSLTRVAISCGLEPPLLSLKLRDDDPFVTAAAKVAHCAVLQYASPRLRGDSLFILHTNQQR